MLELNKIYNMDCLEGMKLKVEVPECDYIISNPPYSLKGEVFKSNKNS